MLDKDIAKNKLIILYIINNFNHELEESELNFLVLNMELFNYFYFKECLCDMETFGLILFDDNKKYYLSEIGKNTLDTFIKEIPQDFLDKLNAYRDDFTKYLRDKNSLKINIFKEDDSYYCKLAINDGDICVMNLKIEVANKDMANIISENFKKNPQIIYKKILGILMMDN